MDLGRPERFLCLLAAGIPLWTVLAVTQSSLFHRRLLFYLWHSQMTSESTMFIFLGIFWSIFELINFQKSKFRDIFAGIGNLLIILHTWKSILVISNEIVDRFEKYWFFMKCALISDFRKLHSSNSIQKIEKCFLFYKESKFFETIQNFVGNNQNALSECPKWSVGFQSSRRYL